MSKGVIFKVPIIIEPDTGEYHAFCPALKGVHVFGETEEDALEHSTEAVEVYVASLIKHEEPIPLCTIEPTRRKNRRRKKDGAGRTRVIYATA
jgi:predicted RNase H-like HicB family nuclease